MLSDKAVDGLGSYEELPEGWMQEGSATGKNGTFSLGGVMPEVVSSVELHKGLFCGTLSDFMAKHLARISSAHLELNLSPSTKYALDALQFRIAPGTIGLFDNDLDYIWRQEREYRTFKRPQRIADEYIDI